jgi:hypothetical protein
MNCKAYASIATLICLTSGFLTSCSSIPGSTSPPPTVTITATSGTGQSATINSPFGATLVATVTTGGTPTMGATVTFTAPATGASGTFAGGGNTATVTTIANGMATSPTFTANATAGPAYTVTATVAGAASPADFSLTNNAGPAAGLSCTSGTPQSATIDTGFGATLGVQVVDSAGNSVNDSGVGVTYTAPAQTGASATFAGGVNTATTNASGMAISAAVSANGIAGGPYVVTASATIGATMKACDFSLTNTVGTPASITATSGTPQSATINTGFAPLVATVTDRGGNAVSGVVVTFTAPATGASGTFAGGGNTATASTVANGTATSPVFTANGTAGPAYTVTATVAGVATPANFSLTNILVTENFTFYLSGTEVIHPNPNAVTNFYALAGAVTINVATGAVTAGEQDYNDASGSTFPDDQITGGKLSVDPTTGQGTLTLTIPGDTHLGVSGTETFAVQFVNANHALIMQFDGTATSSGSMDLQTLPSPLSPPSGNFAFTFSGLTNTQYAVILGGVLSINDGNVSGTLDFNNSSIVETNLPFSAGVTVSTPDPFGRGIVSGVSVPFLNSGAAATIFYYVVGPEAIRLIDMDKSDTAVGSAFGQGTGDFNNASLGQSVFSIGTNCYFGTNGATAGILSTSNTSSSSADFTGVADDAEPINIIPAVSGATISGTYSIGGNGYGSLTITSGNLGNVSALGIYMTDPKLNLNDPNNTTSGLGGALVADLDLEIEGATGVLVPQNDPSPASFKGTYAFGAQVYNDGSEEFDFIGQGTVYESGSNNALSPGIGYVSDPILILSSPSPGDDMGVAFIGFSTQDPVYAGRYTMFAPNQFTIDLAAGPLTQYPVAIYQASGGQLFWMAEFIGQSSIPYNVFSGPLEQQGSLTGIPGASAALANAKPEQKK